MRDFLTDGVMQVCGCKQCQQGTPCLKVQRTVFSIRELEDESVPTKAPVTPAPASVATPNVLRRFMDLAHMYPNGDLMFLWVRAGGSIIQEQP